MQLPVLKTMELSDKMQVLLGAVSSYLFYKAFIPPHAALNSNQRNKEVKGVFSGNASQYFAIMKSYLQLLFGLAEISLILTKEYPASPISSLARSLFLFKGGNPSKLHLNLTRVVGGLMIIAGGYIRVWSMKALGRQFTFQVGIQKDHHLITHGLYSVVRHPAYMGMQLTHVGYLLWHLSPGSWVRESGLTHSAGGALAVGAYAAFIAHFGYAITIMRMRQEDKVIQAQFGKEWEDWASRVPYRVIPGIY